MVEQVKTNQSILTESQYKFCVAAASEWNQGHLFENWPEPGSKDKEKVALAEQLQTLDSHYPGGLQAYINNAKRLLQESKEGKNPFEGMTASIPAGERLDLSTPEGVEEFANFEKTGMDVTPYTCFVIVAGGLGERLGYSHIKLSLLTNLLTEDVYLKHYCEHILALQDRARKSTGNDSLILPLAIMTSGDTHQGTVDLLKNHKNFGMDESQITLIKQEKVPAVLNNDAHFAPKGDGSFLIQTKPHGHGDVHSLLYSSKLISNWVKDGKRYLCFLQDTNAAVFRALPAALGVSESNKFLVNSLTVARKPGEPVGAICKLTKTEGGKEVSLTVNVEYNQLEALLGSDSADSTGFSPYPGNVNILVFELTSYLKVLESTGGTVPEFVNPKYADTAKTKFKKPARLECMMQDYPRLLSAGDKVGFTQMPRWVSFSAVKNSLEEAAAKLQKTGFAESASSGESDIYSLGRQLLSLAGVKMPKEEEIERKEYGGLPVKLGAKIVLKPSFGVTLQEIKSRFVAPEKVMISPTSSLILDGDIKINELTLDGDLKIIAKPGASVEVKKLEVKNDGVLFKTIPNDAPEILRIRGYELERKADGKVIESTSGNLVVE